MSGFISGFSFSRYIICKHKRSDSGPIRDYLFEVNLRLHELKIHDIDVNHIVPMSVLEGDQRFYDYIIKSNNRFGRSHYVCLQALHFLMSEYKSVH